MLKESLRSWMICAAMGGICLAINIGYKVLPKPWRAAFYRRSLGFLLKVLGVRLHVHGKLEEKGPLLGIANHASYLDIPILASLDDILFLSKAEVMEWPLIGTVAKHRTLQTSRRASDLRQESARIRACLEASHRLVLFAEGTTSDGCRILPFRSAFLDFKDWAGPSPLLVQPITISYEGIASLPLPLWLRREVAWFGETGFLEHLRTLATLRGLHVSVFFHPPVRACDFPTRKALASYLEGEIRKKFDERR